MPEAPQTMTAGATDTPLACARDAFHIEGDVRYLNCAYLAPLLKRVEAAGIDGIRRRRRPQDVHPEDFFTEADGARQVFATLVNAPSERIALIPSVSYGMATVAANLEVGRGQTIVIAGEQFPSNVHVWRSLTARSGAEVRTVEPPPPGPRRGERWNGAILDAIDGGTAAVALGNVHWADGTRFDLEAIGERAREVGAALVVDGTQSLGALPFDMERVRPDALVCAAYKWLLGPYSQGVAYLGPRFDGGRPLEETWLGRQGSEDFTTLTRYRDEYQPGAARFDMGERSNFVLLPMLIAAVEQLLEWRPERIQAYCRGLAAPLVEEAGYLGYFVEDAAWRGEHMLGLRLPPHVGIGSLRQALDRRGVVVSLRGDAVRISLHLHNDADDVAALIEALAEVV
jgi:selenocysteine lyase/cysteine desulfurase